MPRLLLAIGTFLALALSLALMPLSQTGSLRDGAESVYRIQVYQDLVLVDVVVTDKKGNPIKNLTRSNFTIYEDNAPQKISTFDYEDLSTIFEQSNKASSHMQEALPVVNLSKSSLEQVPREQFRHRRLIILFFDLSSMPVEDFIQAQTTAQNFIEKQLTPADLVALVVNASSLKLLQSFTNDQEALRAAMRKLNVGDSADLAQLGTTTSEETVSEDLSDAYQADETQFNVFNTDRKLSAIESVGKMFRQLPEKKFLVHFSSGISTTGVENQSQLRATIDALNQASTSLYAVDARGLIAVPPGGDAEQGKRFREREFQWQSRPRSICFNCELPGNLDRLGARHRGKGLIGYKRPRTGLSSCAAGFHQLLPAELQLLKSKTGWKISPDQSVSRYPRSSPEVPAGLLCAQGF